MFIPQKFAHTTQDYLRAALALSGVVVNDSLIMNDQNLPNVRGCRERTPLRKSSRVPPFDKLMGSDKADTPTKGSTCTDFQANL